MECRDKRSEILEVTAEETHRAAEPTASVKARCRMFKAESLRQEVGLGDAHDHSDKAGIEADGQIEYCRHDDEHHAVAMMGDRR